MLSLPYGSRAALYRASRVYYPMALQRVKGIDNAKTIGPQSCDQCDQVNRPQPDVIRQAKQWEIVYTRETRQEGHEKEKSQNDKRAIRCRPPGILHSLLTGQQGIEHLVAIKRVERDDIKDRD